MKPTNLMLWIASALSAPTSIAADQKTEGNCSPTIQGTGGNVTVTCNLSAEGLRLNAKHNWEVARTTARAVLQSNNLYFLPSLKAYVDHPSPQTWAEVKREVGLVRNMLDAAMRSALQYEATRRQDGRPSELVTIHRIYSQRSVRLTELEISTSPMPIHDVNRWMSDYTSLVTQLANELDKFDKSTLTTASDRSLPAKK